jgi:DNA-binding transcriptional MocR family regulator
MEAAPHDLVIVEDDILSDLEPNLSPRLALDGLIHSHVGDD